MKPLNERDLYEVKRAAYEPDQHVSLSAPKSTLKTLSQHGLIAEHGRLPEDDCACGFYILTDAGRALAVEHGITRTWADTPVGAL